MNTVTDTEVNGAGHSRVGVAWLLSWAGSIPYQVAMLFSIVRTDSATRDFFFNLNDGMGMLVFAARLAALFHVFVVLPWLVLGAGPSRRTRLVAAALSVIVLALLVLELLAS